MSAEETSVLVDPNQRIIKQVTIEDVKATSLLFEQLMGTTVAARKQYIKDHSAEAQY